MSDPKIVTVDVSMTLSPPPEPYVMRMAVALNRSPRWCAGFARRKGNDRLFILPFYLMDEEGRPTVEIHNWRRIRNHRICRAWAILKITDVHPIVCAHAYTPSNWRERGMPAADVRIEYDETGTYEVPHTITAEEAASMVVEHRKLNQEQTAPDA